MRSAILLAILLLLSVIAYADVGPSPPSPDVTVELVKSDGTPDLRVQLITYHCMGSNSTSNGAVDSRLADLPCEAGTCRNNGGWFYKFNPCYDFPEGYFSYTLNGKEISTGYFNNTEKHGAFTFKIDSESGKIKSSGNSDLNIPGCCSALFFLPVVAIAALVSRKQ